MGRAELIGQAIEVKAIHDGPLEHFGCLRILLRGDAEIPEDFIGKPVGKFPVKPPRQRDAFVPIDVAGANFLGGIVGGPSDAEFDEGSEIVEIVNAVINAVILAVGARVRSGEAWKPPCSTA